MKVSSNSNLAIAEDKNKVHTMLKAFTLAGSDLDSIIALKTFLDYKFKIKGLGDVEFFLGLKRARSPNIVLNKRKYALNNLEEYGFTGS